MHSSDTKLASWLPDELLGNPLLCVSATTSIRIEANQSAVFDWFADLDISRVLNGFGPLPAVNRTLNQTGPWNTPGQRRTLDMSRGITATQEILISNRPEFFAYRVTGFTHFIDVVCRGAEARWWFDPLPDGSTHMTWTYTFWPRSIAGMIAVYPVIRTIWYWYMKTAIREMKRLAEAEAAH